MSDPVRALVVEDESAIRRVLLRVLGSLGYECMEATDGREALHVLDAWDVDVVVSDVRMPQMDGVELLREVAARDLDVPVVLITGAPTLESAIQAVEYGAFNYITKPFDHDELKRVVSRAVNLRRMARLKGEALALSATPGGRAGDREALAAAFDRVLENHWIAYQPILAARDASVFAYEALLRTDDPGLPHPGSVFHAAERLDRLFELGRRLRASAAHPMLDRQTDSLLFVNLHPRDLGDDDLYDRDATLSQIAPRVVLEITERASLEDVADVSRRVARLREMGFRIALDDLGAGYAGLTSFARLQPEFVKIDMTLVRGVDRDPVRRRLVGSMANLCRDMGIRVIAEGIETEAEWDCVAELGCDLLQGFFGGRPQREMKRPQARAPARPADR